MLALIKPHTLISGMQRRWGPPAGRAESLLKKMLSGLIRRLSAVSGIRRKKVRTIRRQLDAGTYDIDGRLSVAMDKLLEEMIGPDHP